MEINPEYHKIQNVYNRDPKTNHKTLIEEEWSMPEFEYLANNQWLLTEKVDGTNIRVHWYEDHITFSGKTNDAEIPKPLLERLKEIFTLDKLNETFGGKAVTLYGEGYGKKIQKTGHLYLPDSVDFILFDVLIGGIFLERNNVEDIASKLALKTVPVVAKCSLFDAIDLTKKGFPSFLGDLRAEGVVCKPLKELQTRNGKRIITKIKTCDFSRSK